MTEHASRAVNAAWSRIARVGKQLALWALASVVLGGVLLFTPSPLWGAVGVQFLVWGAIDGVIAWAGLRDARRKRTQPSFATREAVEAERRRVVRLLRINAVLDVGYVVVGLALLGWEPSATRVGHGVGVLIQGGFLLVFDVAHAVLLSSGGEPGDAHPIS